MKLRTCVAPSGRFVFGVHKPEFSVHNIRENDYIDSLGEDEDGSKIENKANFPAGGVIESNADWVYEIANPFAIRGSTYISKEIADTWAQHPHDISIPTQPDMSFIQTASEWFSETEWSPQKKEQIFRSMPDPIKIAVAGNSVDPEDLRLLAELSAEFLHDHETGQPIGLAYSNDKIEGKKPRIHNYPLFKVLANNPYLPDEYKVIMVLKPGAQGKNEIVGDWFNDDRSSHVFEYLRRNSYIPWGHYAANMAHDAVRYRIQDLILDDIIGLRHLYYQRTYLRVAEMLGIPFSSERKRLDTRLLENLRNHILSVLTSTDSPKKLPFTSTLWGWNFGFGYAPSRYRLHGSHQQIHQQYALVPETVSDSDPAADESPTPAYACGDLIRDFINEYHQVTGKRFFECYIKAIRNNKRTDGNKDKESRLIVYENGQAMVFVPKAQTSQWELQIMPMLPVGNILEADIKTRRSLDEALLIAMRILEAMGARMITGIEFSKRFDSNERDQRLLYCLMPRLPLSPGAFSEAQLRFINNHYPEDFAIACRAKLDEALTVLKND